MASSPPRPDALLSPSSSLIRPRSSLLPAFEPLSSSPALPKPLKRTRDALEENSKYPTPLPTSSTAIISSSPPRQQVQRHSAQRTLSTLSERAPLSSVPTVQLDSAGKPVLMGRSGASCNFQMPANRLISRVHVEACYKPALSRLERDRVEIRCVGWNGLKIHCQGRVYDLRKGETFSSDIRVAGIMVDVQDPRIKAEGARVMVVWPEKPRLGAVSSDEEDEASPTKKQRPMLRHSTPPSPSPLHIRRRPVSPVSPSPAVEALLPSSPPLLPGQLKHAPVDIYEDPGTEDQENQESGPITQSTQVLTQVQDFGNDAEDSAKQDFSENDEENDPIVHSFGPFGANLLPQMAAFTAGCSPSPQAGTSTKTSRSSHTEPLQPNHSPSQPTSVSAQFNVRDHIINQLAFSRLSSTPLSTILSHLPHEVRPVSTEQVRDVIRGTECIGEIAREGKDAAGKVLESEYYYIPDVDVDEKRKEAVVNDLMKPSLRSCRKQHKQYFWRKPKKP